ncbi:MAG TPA: prolyl oligopeptidase family serine peptidase [Anaerolineales bacterium]|nr:prolyl oligopeptidase family serine peptidase [Anaerolineales bacterium]
MLRFRLPYCVLVLLTMALTGCANQPGSTSAPPITTTQNTTTLVPSQNPPPTQTPAVTKTRVTFTSDNLTLEGFLYKPSGDGPFPAIVWNHGNEQDPDSSPEFDAVANIFVPAGYIVFAPVRRGQGQSQGDSIQSQMQQVLSAKGSEAAQQFFVQQMEGPQLDDQLAGLNYLKSLSDVDQNRLVVAGCSYGGIQSILAAANGAGYKAALAISPGSESWDGNPLLQQSLTKAVSSINIPVFLIHPEKDVSVAPGYALAQQFLKLNKSYSFKIYPPFGADAEQGLCFGDGNGFHWWAPDVLTFLGNALSPASAASPPSVHFAHQQVTVQSDGLNLVAYVYKPAGPGPFPGIIWNHGSEPDPTPENEFGSIASVFVPAGYVVVDPVRRGQGGSQGQYIQDAIQQEFQAHGRAAADQLFVQWMGSQELDDQLAGYTYLLSLPYVDKNRTAVVGCSYGGIETLLGAESGPGYKAAVALSPGAESWNGSPLLPPRLLKAVDDINIPTLIIHPAQDASLEPGYTLGPEFQRLGKPYGLQIFAPFGKAVQHCFGGGSPGEGESIWGPDALSFLSNVLH